MSDLRVALAEPGDLPALLALRHEVFVVGQGVPEDLEHDPRDPGYDHAVARLDGRVVGTGRLLPDGTVGRMAVADDVRGRGIGAAVLAALEQRAAQRGLAEVTLHAQVHAVGFYERAGYVAFTGCYLEAGIEHVSMRKSLTREPS